MIVAERPGWAGKVTRNQVVAAEAEGPVERDKCPSLVNLFGLRGLI